MLPIHEENLRFRDIEPTVLTVTLFDSLFLGNKEQIQYINTGSRYYPSTPEQKDKKNGE